MNFTAFMVLHILGSILFTGKIQDIVTECFPNFRASIVMSKTKPAGRVESFSYRIVNATRVVKGLHWPR